MPNRFSLTRKSNLAAGPVPLPQIDHEMCEAFGIVRDPDKYYCNWFDTIGIALASGQSFDAIINDCHKAIEEQSKIANQDGVCYWTLDGVYYWTSKVKIAEYLQKNFIADCWADIGKR